MAGTSLIADDLRVLGLLPGDKVLLHSSFSSLQKTTPAEAISAFFDVIGETGTLILPALSYQHCNANNPVFDYRNTPSNVGYLPEYFRTQYTDRAVFRSMSPTHSCCAAGADADWVTSGHILDHTPCGEKSPFARLRELNGKILFLGCGLRPNTSMHAIEELYTPPYLFGEAYDFEMTDKNGKRFSHRCLTHNFRGVTQRYDRVENIMTVKKGKVSGADCFLLEANTLWHAAGAVYRQDPFYFVDRA